jgi:hypothetical protein
VLCPTHKVETRPIRHDRVLMIETCHLCKRQKLEGTIRPRAKPSTLRKSQVFGQHPITSPMDHFTK